MPKTLRFSFLYIADVMKKQLSNTLVDLNQHNLPHSSMVTCNQKVWGLKRISDQKYGDILLSNSPFAGWLVTLLQF